MPTIDADAHRLRIVRQGRSSEGNQSKNNATCDANEATHQKTSSCGTKRDVSFWQALSYYADTFKEDNRYHQPRQSFPPTKFVLAVW